MSFGVVFLYPFYAGTDFSHQPLPNSIRELCLTVLIVSEVLSWRMWWLDLDQISLKITGSLRPTIVKFELGSVMSPSSTLLTILVG